MKPAAAGRRDEERAAPGEPEPVQDARLLAAAGRVLEDAGWQGLAARINFSEPFARLFADGAVDGSLAPPGEDPAAAAELLFNTLCWSYVHLRGRHHWTAERARQGLHRLITPGLGPCRTAERPAES